MTIDQRLIADFLITGFTIGSHPMAYRRAEMEKAGVLSAADLKTMQDGAYVRIAGTVIARQRPGPAKGFIFLSNEDETGISNATIHPKIYEENRMTVTGGKFLLIEGKLQNQDGVVLVKASSVRELEFGSVAAPSPNFH